MTASEPALAETDPGPLLELEAFLPYRLNVSASLVSNALAQIYAERFGLTIPGWRVIATLGQYGARAGRDIGAHAVMHKSTVSRAVASLEERGLVARRANPHDFREELVALTSEGRALYRELAPEALAFAQRLEAALSPTERNAFLALLDRLDRHTRGLGSPSSPEMPT